MLESNDLARRLGDERLHGVLVRQIVASPDRVEGVELEAVVLSEDGCRPPSAATVWLRIGYTFDTSATLRASDASAHAIAARRPAAPPPTITMS